MTGPIKENEESPKLLTVVPVSDLIQTSHQSFLPKLEITDIKSDPELIGFWLQGRAFRTIEAYRLELKRFFKFTGGMKLSCVQGILRFPQSSIGLQDSLPG